MACLLPPIGLDMARNTRKTHLQNFRCSCSLKCWAIFDEAVGGGIDVPHPHHINRP